MKKSLNASSGGEKGNAPLITVAICTYNRYSLLRKLIATLADQTLLRSSFEVLIVDNTDNEADRKAFADEVHGWPGLQVVYSSPPGLSQARNVALEQCGTEYIVFIDDDALPRPEWLSSLLDVFKKSGASVVAGPIEPIWPIPQPDWLPSKYIACLAILDHGTIDRELSEYEFAYGTNMAFRVDALREIGGFKVGLGRIGSRTLISDEEIEVQLALRARGHKSFYAAAARVSHLVHENRISRNYFRARMAWQAVSTLMHDSPFFWAEQSRQEIIRASSELGVGEFIQRLFARQNATTFSTQLDLIYHLLLLILDSKNMDDLTFEQQFAALAPTPGGSFANDGASADAKIFPEIYSPTAAIGPDTRHLFVEAQYCGHSYLFDVYAEIPGSQLLTLPANAWDKCDDQLKYLENSLAPQIETLTFLTLEPLVYGPSRQSFNAMLGRLKIPVFGILHRPPSTPEHGQALREAAARMRSVIVLAEPLATRLRDTYAVTNSVYLPHHPPHYMYIGQDRAETRKRIGAWPSQLIFSVMGEARRGKGIELLLAALDHIAPEDRARMFFLFGGRAKDFDPEYLRSQLLAKRYYGYVDLRRSANPLDYVVLTDPEFGNYVNVSDFGILLYQEDQHDCMSGVLPNYVWGRQPVIALANSVVGQLVQEYDLGITVTEESPMAVANALTAALRGHGLGSSKSATYESFRATVVPENVIQRLFFLLSHTHTKELASSNDTVPEPEPPPARMNHFDRYLSELPLLHSWDNGQTWNTGGFERGHLQKLHDFLKEHLPSFPRLLETGAGNTTISLLFLSPARLVSIAPDAALFERIRSYCESHHIPTDALEPHVEGSEWALPRMAEEMERDGLRPFDFVLIDGCHNWPMVFVDFLYCNFMLRSGGYIMIDDVHLHSVKELARMLSEQPEFELALDLGKSLVFRRRPETSARLLREWNNIPYIVRRTTDYSHMDNPFSL